MAILAILLALVGFFLSTSIVYGEFTFTIPQNTITSDQEIDASVTLSLQGQDNKTYYLEGDKKMALKVFGDAASLDKKSLKGALQIDMAKLGLYKDFLGEANFQGFLN